MGVRSADTLVVGRRRGAVGLVYVSDSDRNFLLTNAHVVSSTGKRVEGRQVEVEGVSGPVGIVHRMPKLEPSTTNRVDAALVWTFSGVELDFVKVKHHAPAVSAIGHFDVGAGDRYFIQSRRSHKRLFFERPEFETSETSVTVAGRSFNFSNFWRLSHAGGPPVREGDSGSVVFCRRRRRLEACGLLIAGGGNTIAAFELHDVFRQLGERNARSNRRVERVFPRGLPR